MPQLELRTVQLDLHRGRLDLGDRDESRLGLGGVRAVAAGHLLGGRVAGREGLRDRVVVVSVLDAEGLKSSQEGVAGLAERNAVLRTARPGEARLDRAEVEVHDLAVGGLDLLVVEEVLGAAVALDARDVLVASTRHAQVGERLLVHREEAAGRAVLRRHVRDGGAVGEREPGEPGAEELDELADDAELPERLGHGENEVGRRRALGQAAGEPEADDLGHQHRERLAEHRRLRLDPAHTPAEDAEAVDHGRVRVGADESVRKGPAVPLLDDAREVLQVDLVDDAGVRRDDTQVVEGLLAPAQECVALAVPLELELRVLEDRDLRAEHVHLDGVVDDELGREKRVDPRRLTAQVAHRIAHGGEVDDRRDAGEVLEQNPRRAKGDLPVRLIARLPFEDRPRLLQGRPRRRARRERRSRGAPGANTAGARSPQPRRLRRDARYEALPSPSMLSAVARKPLRLFDRAAGEQLCTRALRQRRCSSRAPQRDRDVADKASDLLLHGL